MFSVITQSVGQLKERVDYARLKHFTFYDGTIRLSINYPHFVMKK